MIRDRQRTERAGQGRVRLRRLGWLGGLVLAACGGRDADLDASFADEDAVGLQRAVALGDGQQNRVVMLTSSSPSDLSVTPLPVGENRAAMVPSVDGNGLLVLSSGERPRRNADDELPSLTLI